MGYEDLNDHDELRRDPLLALLCDQLDISDKMRKRRRHKGCALAGKSTLNRLKLTPAKITSDNRYKKIEANPAAMTLFWLIFL